MLKFVYLFSKSSLCPENGVQTWRGKWRSYDLQTICSKYRPETCLAPSAMAHKLCRKLSRNMTCNKWCSYIGFRHSTQLCRKWVTNMTCSTLLRCIWSSICDKWELRTCLAACDKTEVLKFQMQLIYLLQTRHTKLKE